MSPRSILLEARVARRRASLARQKSWIFALPVAKAEKARLPNPRRATTRPVTCTAAPAASAATRAASYFPSARGPTRALTQVPSATTGLGLRSLANGFSPRARTASAFAARAARIASSAPPSLPELGATFGPPPGSRGFVMRRRSLARLRWSVHETGRRRWRRPGTHPRGRRRADRPVRRDPDRAKAVPRAPAHLGRARRFRAM